MFALSSPQAFAFAPASVQVLPAGTWLRQRRHASDQVLYLERGRVLMGTGQGGQMRHQLGVVDGPAWLDAAFVLQKRGSCLDMLADSEVRVSHLSQAEFMQAVAALPQTAQLLLQDMSRAYCAQTELAVSRLSKDAEARCAQWLLRHALPYDTGGLRVTLHLRKRLIAAQLGIAPETFSRVLRQLRELGLIAGRGNVIDLPRPAALEALAVG
ncbi:MAG: Crp/Fnr family transcriptional regulator [Comamonas sp.]|jgi:CRP-like cAMP-binding protein|uniref:Crp/Fnr family transcriptional regulator n=1 Tax=Comamonas sp. TaxID=34028 RepID=UPI00281ED225|nr:Crp/Fnr family transcriptional regulator [Comamonas sp.]MDR0214025.1 Crp/Fnr family transcriptional regulator [Comamonas sp.]